MTARGAELRRLGRPPEADQGKYEALSSRTYSSHSPTRISTTAEGASDVLRAPAPCAVLSRCFGPRGLRTTRVSRRARLVLSASPVALGAGCEVLRTLC